MIKSAIQLNCTPCGNSQTLKMFDIFSLYVAKKYKLAKGVRELISAIRCCEENSYGIIGLIAQTYLTKTVRIVWSWQANKLIGLSANLSASEAILLLDHSLILLVKNGSPRFQLNSSFRL